MNKERKIFEAIKEKLRYLKTANVDIVVVLLPKEEATTYSILKRAGDVAVGIYTLCTIADNHHETTKVEIYETSP